MNPKVDAYIRRSEKWPEEMAGLRPTLLGCGLTEEIKWGKPCYGHGGKNISRLDRDPALKAAFEALTPGRRREYNLYFSGAKQAGTRAARVERYVAKILDGKGFRDR